MSAKRALISAAFGELGLATYAFDVSTDRLTAALGRLNRLAAQWDGMGIRVGYVMGDDIDAESGIPDTCEEAFVTNLALRIAPSLGKTSDRLVEIKVAAKTSFNALIVANIKRPEVPYPSNMPLGAGNKAPPNTAQTFPDTGDEIVGLNDGATEF